jgi:GT2 family glycosyltransferase
MPGTPARDRLDVAESVAVQIVIYENPVDQLVRLAAGVAASVRAARTAGAVDRVVVRFGDCSPTPALDVAGQQAIGGELDGAVDDVSFTYFDANLGSAGGSNALAALADESVIWVLNPDTYPAPRAAAELLTNLALADDVAAAEARQIPVEHPKWYDPQTGETGWVAGACVMFRRSAFDAVGGFDSHFFPLYCDDVDVSWRLRLAGWRLVHVPSAVVFHDKRPHLDGSVRASPTEARSTFLATLWLYRRYGRPDLEAACLDELERSGSGGLGGTGFGDVAAEFRQRTALGDAPEVIDRAAHVADFVDGQFAPRRFIYR